ncbi:hypothetical protein [Sagittula sp. S175]|uniref:DUF7742 family protein n=1 Tax=Sagittula sp. S175 TaxID=3415129 RepID=UPI003C79FD85
MRPVLSQDINAAARALMPVPPEARRVLIRRMLAEADAADAFRRTHRKAHATWGDGTLMAAALARPVARETPLSGDYLECQYLVLEALLKWRNPNAGAGAEPHDPEPPVHHPEKN